MWEYKCPHITVNKIISDSFLVWNDNEATPNLQEHLQENFENEMTPHTMLAQIGGAHIVYIFASLLMDSRWIFFLPISSALCFTKCMFLINNFLARNYSRVFYIY